MEWEMELKIAKMNGSEVQPQSPSLCSDDNGCIKRTGNVWTTSARIITAVISSGLPFLAWAIAQLGWIAGPTVMFLFSLVFYYTASLLADCYQSGDPVTGKRNNTYSDAVRANLGGVKVKICGVIEYLYLFGVAIGYTVTASISMMAIKRSNCFHKSGGKHPCQLSSNHYMIMFGISEIIFCQIPIINQIFCLSVVTAVMSFTYSSIGLGLGIARVAARSSFKGSLTGISIGTVTQTQKIWRSFQALGDIASAYSHLTILIKIQNTIESPHLESKTMKKATLLSITITTAFKMLCACMAYASFGDRTPSTLLSGFGFHNPFWLLDIANVALIIHLVSAYQLCCQPLLAFVEKWAIQRFPNSEFITREIPIPFGNRPYKLSLFRLVWRSTFVVVTTIISMLLPFSTDVFGVVGSFGFWPLTVYFPVEMYIAQKKIPKWSAKWVCLQIFSLACLIILVAAMVGSIAGVVIDLKTYRPFKTKY
ncbi:amino acid permease 3-like isoform X1 [Magnolia sinica]|uniref:amino acid permease 3-like isoform X1 n=1 Tax=Magnolia sinica TaxID=86752 RepID=UPI00265A73EA|nr:amino acid permease 3-like isoform X1 [Magnolia sinica]